MYFDASASKRVTASTRDLPSLFRPGELNHRCSSSKRFFAGFQFYPTKYSGTRIRKPGTIWICSISAKGKCATGARLSWQ